MRLTKIHKILQFEQKAWLKSCIDFNTEQSGRGGMETNL